MKQLYNAVMCACALLLIGACAPAYAATPGSTCYSAIPMTKEPDQDFTYKVTSASPTSPKEVWFSAQTFDLPLSVYFAPDDGMSTPAPEVEMDFSCISGYYENEILCSLFCKTGGNSGIDMHMPYKATLSSKKLDDGTFVYYMQLGEKYRNLLLQMGISENLKVVVHVIFKSTGVLKLAPDNFFTNCMDNAQFMQLGDTVHVKAKDKETHVIVPYVQWQEDTIVYTWSGTEPCRLTVSATCEFDPTDPSQELVQYDAIEPGGSKKVKAENIYEWVHNKDFPPQAGMYFAKIYSEAGGDMRITKAPQGAPEGGAILMRYGTSYALDANSKAIYAIPRSWNVSVMFSSPTVHLFSMQFSKTASFGEADILATYTYKLTESGRWVGVASEEMKNLWKSIPTGKQYMYVRFICTEATSITADRWNISECYEKTLNYFIEPDQSITVGKTSSQVYRFSYPQWKGGDMTIDFAINSNCEVYIADTCGMTRTKADADYWLKYKAITKSTAPLVIPAAEIDSWADRIDDEGCIYALFYTSANSTNRKLTFTTSAPEETDPVYPTTTIAVACDESKQPYLTVSNSQTITVKNEDGEVVKTIPDAQPDTKYSLSDLPAGKYTLEGETEKIAIIL